VVLVSFVSSGRNFQNLQEKSQYIFPKSSNSGVCQENPKKSHKK